MDNDTTKDLLNYDAPSKTALPGGLNVLTILTFIWCAIQFGSSVWSFFSAKTSFENKDKVLEQMNSDAMPKWAKSMMGNPAHFEQIVTKSYENRIPIVLLSLVAVALCFIGALQMRKLKKQGFILYAIGELLPFLTLLLFIGAFSFSGVGFYVIAFFALLFIFLYYLQQKNLVN